MYGGLCDEDEQSVASVLDYEDWITFGNEVQDAVHDWLASGRPAG